MNNFTKKLMTTPQNNYSKELYAKTKKYQKLYGFELGNGSTDTWNNEADAFKHTFMSADLALKSNAGISKILGDYHEQDGKTHGQDIREENMDKWNNREGRKIAQKIAKNIGNSLLTKKQIYSGELDDIIAREVMLKMKKGELITNPFTDKRIYKETTSFTGYAAPVNYNENNIFTVEEIKNMSNDDFNKNWVSIVNQMKNIGIPYENELNEKQYNDSPNSHWVTINGNHVLIED